MVSTSPIRPADAYLSDWADLVSFLTTHRLPAQLPIHHALVVLYLSYLAHHGTLMATIDRRLAAIRFIHEQARTVGQLDEEALSPTEHPMLRRTRRNLARRLGTAPENRRKALYTEEIQRILTTLPVTPIGARDRALLLVGFAGGFRRSELVGIDVEHVEPMPNGIAVLLPKSKTDQRGRGRSVGILHGEDPPHVLSPALKAWLTAASITAGPVFRAVDRHGNVASERLSAGSVARIVNVPPNKQASTPRTSPAIRSAPVTPPPQPVAVPTTEPSCAKPDIAPAEPSTGTSKMANSSTTTTQVESSACDYPLPVRVPSALRCPHPETSQKRPHSA